MKLILTALAILLLLSIFLVCQNASFKAELASKPQDVIAKMKGIQKDIGCTRIDGVIGPETTALYKIAQKEVFNDFAAPYMTSSGSPER